MCYTLRIRRDACLNDYEESCWTLLSGKHGGDGRSYWSTDVFFPQLLARNQYANFRSYRCKHVTSVRDK